DAEPFLILVLGFDDAQHHYAAVIADRPPAGVVDRPIPFGGVVNDDKTFRLVTRFVASSLGAHACPGAALAASGAGTSRSAALHRACCHTRCRFGRGWPEVQGRSSGEEFMAKPHGTHDRAGRYRPALRNAKNQRLRMKPTI